MAPALEPTAIEAKAFDQPDETKNLDKAKLDYVTVGGVKLVRTTFEPGWTWLGSIAPVAGTETCQATHIGYCVSGNLRIRSNDGAEILVKPGDAYTIPPGHLGYNEGGEPYVAIELVL